MPKNIIKKDNIKLNVEVSNWREAIRVAGEILLMEGEIEKNYIENMIEAVEKYGPYIVIAPGIAFAHAKPGEYVNKDCISLIRLKEPVNFGCGKDEVSLVFAFGASGDDEHMKFIILYGSLHQSSPAAIDLVADDDQTGQSTADQHANLQNIRPNHRFDAAEDGIDRTQNPHDQNTGDDRNAGDSGQGDCG